jgi:hypothetical protein
MYAGGKASVAQSSKWRTEVGVVVGSGAVGAEQFGPGQGSDRSSEGTDSWQGQTGTSGSTGDEFVSGSGGCGGEGWGECDPTVT